MSKVREVAAHLHVGRTWPEGGPWGVRCKLPRGRPQLRVRQGREGWGAGAQAGTEHHAGSGVGLILRAARPPRGRRKNTFVIRRERFYSRVEMTCWRLSSSLRESVQLGEARGSGGEKIKGIRRCAKASIISRPWCPDVMHQVVPGTLQGPTPAAGWVHTQKPEMGSPRDNGGEGEQDYGLVLDLLSLRSSGTAGHGQSGF